MDQDLKQRLVGAVVITALAAIFIPMLFDDPIDQSGKMINELKIPEPPVQAINEDAIKLPYSTDDVTNLPETDLFKEKSLEQKTAKKMVRWFLQVGSFSQKSNAVSLQNKIRQQGFSATISKVSDNKGYLYKVRVGPELNKKRAETMKIKIDKLNKIKSIMTADE